MAIVEHSAQFKCDNCVCAGGRQSPAHRGGPSPKTCPRPVSASEPEVTNFALHLQVPTTAAAASGESYQYVAVSWGLDGVLSVTAPAGTGSTVVSNCGGSCSSTTSADGYGQYTIGRTYTLHFKHVVITPDAPLSPPHNPVTTSPLTAAAAAAAASPSPAPPQLLPSSADALLLPAALDWDVAAVATTQDTPTHYTSLHSSAEAASRGLSLHTLHESECVD